jgi:hypothetical protein
MTVADLGERMTAAELADWAAYEQVAGPLLLHDRVDVAGALVAYATAKAAGAKHVRPRDFLPQWDRPQRDPWEALMSLVPEEQR